MHSKLGNIVQSIEQMQKDAQNKLYKNKSKIWTSLHANLERQKEEFRQANEKRMGNQQNISDKEKSNKETLETMSSMA